MKPMMVFVVMLSLVLSTVILKAQGAGMAITLDGEDDFVDLSSVDFGLSEELTLTAWIRWQADPEAHGSVPGGQWSTVISNSSSRERYDGKFWLQHDSTNNHFEFAVGASGYDFVNSYTIPDGGKWYHITTKRCLFFRAF